MFIVVEFPIGYSTTIQTLISMPPKNSYRSTYIPTIYYTSNITNIIQAHTSINYHL